MWPERAMGLGVFVAVTAVALVMVLPSMSPPEPLPDPVYLRFLGTEDGGDAYDLGMGSDVPVTIDDLPLEAEQFLWAVWQQESVVILPLERELLEISTEVYGRNTMAPGVVHPGDPDLMVMAFQGTNTHLGCSQGYHHDLGADPDHLDLDGDGDKEGRFLGPCHQEQYNPYNLGKQIPGTPGDGDLWMLDLSWATDGTLIGTGPIEP